jgi:hypothetical protein
VCGWDEADEEEEEDLDKRQRRAVQRDKDDDKGANQCVSRRTYSNEAMAAVCAWLVKSSTSCTSAHDQEVEGADGLWVGNVPHQLRGTHLPSTRYQRRAAGSHQPRPACAPARTGDQDESEDRSAHPGQSGQVEWGRMAEGMVERVPKVADGEREERERTREWPRWLGGAKERGCWRGERVPK